MNETTPAPRGRLEKKFLVEPRHVSFVRTWLHHVALPDPAYARNQVNSLYYDTRQLALGIAKGNSDYLKAKVRVRWYGDRPVPGAPFFLEVKTKEGSRTLKYRTRLSDGGEILARGEPFPEATMALASEVCRLFPLEIGALYPVCVVSYRRSRFVDPATGWRLALDEDVHFTAHPGHWPWQANRSAVEQAVFELKGPDVATSPPAHLRPHPDIPYMPEAFSKYYTAVERLSGMRG